MDFNRNYIQVYPEYIAPEKYGYATLTMRTFGGSKKYKFLLNRFFWAPTPKYGKKIFLDPPPKKKKKFGGRAS